MVVPNVFGAAPFGLDKISAESPEGRFLQKALLDVSLALSVWRLIQVGVLRG